MTIDKPPSTFTAMASIALAVLFVGAPCAKTALAEDWPQWRGPHRTAVSQEVGLLHQWKGEGPKSLWMAEGLGEGYASVVISRGRTFTIGRRGEDVYCFAFDARSGKRLWMQRIGQTTRIPSSTPTLDGDRLYALDPDGDLVCLKTDSGDLVWKKSFLKDLGGKMMSSRGYAESPLIDGDQLICTPGGAESMLAALDKRTGQVRWQSKMPDIGKRGADGAGFSSVVVSNAAGVNQYVQLAGRGLIGVAANSGRFLWGYNDLAGRTANIPTPIAVGDYVFAANGYNMGSVLLKLLPNSAGGVKAVEVYRLRGNRFQNHHGGIVRLGDYIFGGHGSNNGLPTCLNWKTGEILWKRRGPGIGSAAVVYADGHLYFRYQNGVMALIEASPKQYRLKGAFQIPGAGGDSWSHPVVAQGRLYLREKDRLWAYDIRRISSVPAKRAAPADAPLTVEPLPPPKSKDPADKLAVFRFALGGEKNGNGRPIRLTTLTNQHITSQGEIAAKTIEQLESLRGPVVVSLAGTRITDKGLQRITALKDLVGLDLELCPRLTDAGLKDLQKARQLKVLVLIGDNITDKGIIYLLPLKHLVALHLEFCDAITDAACEALGSLTQLRALVLKKNGFEPKRITNAGIKKLRHLRRLEWLSLYGNAATDDGLTHLGSMKQLQQLDLSLLPITDSGLVHLRSLPKLRRLELLFSTGFAGPLVTDEGLDHLQSIKSLRKLNLTGAKLSDAAIARFQTAAPQTKIKR